MVIFKILLIKSKQLPRYLLLLDRLDIDFLINSKITLITTFIFDIMGHFIKLFYSTVDIIYSSI